VFAQERRFISARGVAVVCCSMSWHVTSKNGSTSFDIAAAPKSCAPDSRSEAPELIDSICNFARATAAVSHDVAKSGRSGSDPFSYID
jgi:hypothetical protein